MICGDFNSVPSCGIYQLYTTGLSPDTLPDWKSSKNFIFVLLYKGKTMMMITLYNHFILWYGVSQTQVVYSIAFIPKVHPFP